jgi:GT2 family glycosyltransferase
MDQTPSCQVSVVIGSFNRRRFLRHTIATVREELADLKGEIIVVDGGSADGTLPWLVKQKDVISITQHNRGVWRGKAVNRRTWGYFMNLGFKVAQGEFICMLSDDSLLVPGAIQNGIATARSHAADGRMIGAVAFYWRNWPEMDRYWVGYTFGRMFVNHGLYVRDALATVGYADEVSYSFYHGDGDICLRMAEQGFLCVDSPESFVEHFSHANLAVRTSNLDLQQRDWQAYMRRWRHLQSSSVARRGCDTPGEWKYIEHNDQTRTCQRFRQAMSFRERLRCARLVRRMG